MRLNKLKRLVKENKRYLKLIMANDTGIMLSQTQAGIFAKTKIPSFLSIITNLRLWDAITAQTRNVKIYIIRFVSFFI